MNVALVAAAVIGSLFYVSRPRVSSTKRVYLISQENIYASSVIIWPHADRNQYWKNLCTDADRANTAFDKMVEQEPAPSYKQWSVPALVIGPGSGYTYGYEVSGPYNLPVGGILHRSATRALTREHMIQDANGGLVVDPARAHLMPVIVE
jgi:hypothetical protein